MNAPRILLVVLAMAGSLTMAFSAEAPKDPLIPRVKAAQFFSVEAMRQKNPRVSIEDFELVTGLRAAQYPLSKIDFYLGEAAKELKAAELTEELKTRRYFGPKTFPWLALRRSASDVLGIEDPTLATDPEKSFDDLEGALISFHRDFIKDTDTWSAEAALLAPFSWATSDEVRTGTSLRLARWGVIPSFTLNRVSASGDAADEIDLRIYRAGVFLKFESGIRFPSEVTIRGSAAYTQDAQHDGETMAGEFEIEPQADFSQRAKLGYRSILIVKPKARRKDPQDTATLAYQFRALLRGEYGSVSNDGPAFSGMEFDYFRLGPVLQLDFKPLFFRQLQLSLRYQYLPTISGGEQPVMAGIQTEDGLFRADLSWLVVDPEESPGRRIMLKASYINGGLGPLQEKTETLLIGLGAAF